MLRVGLICDFAEERWTSMDLVGDMLFEQINRRHGRTVRTDRMRPALRRRATALRALSSSHAAWNGDRVWNRMVEYPRWLRGKRDGYDIFHIVDHSYAHLALDLPAGRTVVTCHDLDAFRCLTEPAAEPRPFCFKVMARRILRGLRAAAHVTFVSQAVRQQASRLKLIPEERSSVIPNGVHAGSGANSGADREAARLLGAEVGNPLLLSVASTIPRKRIDMLLRVFAVVAEKHRGVKLVRVGGPLTVPQAQLAQQLGIGESIVELPFLDRAVLSAVYRRATLLLQPSEAEGFGLPVAEAMAFGCPVVASDLPALRETGGEAAVYRPVGNVSEWSEAVTDLLHECQARTDFWYRLRDRSIENAKRFSSDDMADRVVNVYREVAGND